MKRIKRLLLWLPIVAISLIIAGSSPVSAAQYGDYLSGNSDISVKLDEEYKVIDGVYEAEMTLTKAGGTTVKAHVLLVKPYAKASFKPVVPNYYTSGSTKESRAKTAEEWTDSKWDQLGLTNMIGQYNSAADTADEPVIAAINGNFSLGSGAPRGPIVMEGNWMMHSDAAEDEFLFGRKTDSGALNIVQRISGQADLYDTAICGSAYILRNGSLFGVDAENDARQRTGIALRTNGDTLLITVENPGISVKQLAGLMQSSGCWNGVNMDGGGSITFITQREGEELTRKTPDVADSYADKDENGERKICSGLMLVADNDAVANKMPDIETVGNTVKTDEDTYKQGDPIYVTATTNSDGAWVGLIGADDESAKPGSSFWYYIYGSNDAGTWGWENGATYDICTDGISGIGGYSSALLAPGNYKAAVINYSEDGSSYEILASKTITVEHNPELVMDDYTLKTDKDVYEVGEPIMTTITAPLSDGTAWVGITEHGHVAADNNATYYWYYNSATNAGISHTNGVTYNLFEQEQIGDYDINDANVNADLIDREKKHLLPGKYDIIVYSANGYTPAVDKDGNVVKKTIDIVDTKAVYNIIYKDGENDITGLTPTTYTYLEAQEGSIELPATAEKAGHEFIGWYDNAEFSGTAATNIPMGSNGNKTFYAKFNKLSYEVTFDTDGAGTIASQTVPYGDNATQPSEPEKEEYRFLGWVTEKDGTEAFDFSAPITGNTTIYAKWQFQGDYDIAFDTDGGSAVLTQSINAGDKVVKPSEEPKKTGYIFDKWVTEKNGTTEYDFDAVVTESMTIYASWIPVEYTITFDTVGGKTVEAVKYNIESETFKLPETTKDNHSFIVWKDENGNAVIEITKGTYGDIKLTAEWKKEYYLTTDRSEYYDGQQIKVTAYCDIPNSWVGIYKEGDVIGTDFSYFWEYMVDGNGNSIHNDEPFNLLNYKSADNNKSFDPGTYDVILFDSGYGILASKTIMITENTDPVKGTLTLSGASRTDKEYTGLNADYRGNNMHDYYYGDAIYVETELTGNGTEGAWVGVITDEQYREGKVNDLVSPSHWYYVEDFEGQKVNLNYVSKSKIEADTEPLPKYGLNYWAVLVSGSGKILDGKPFNYRTFNVDWLDSDWGIAVSNKIAVSLDWISNVTTGENLQPKVTLTHKGHFGMADDGNGGITEITEKVMVEGHDYTLTYPEESKEVGTYNIKVTFPSSQPSTDYYDYLNSDALTYGFKNGIKYFITESEDDRIIEYVLNGGTNKKENPDIYKVGNEVNLYSPTKLGYSFDGWYTTPDFKKGTNVDTIEKTSTDNPTLYAKWVLEADAPHSIKYVLNGGDDDITNPSAYTGKANITLAPAKKAGHIFVGWFYDDDFTMPADVIKKGRQGNLTLYAKFVKSNFEITTDVENGTITDGAIVKNGSSFTVEYAADSGYMLKSVTVDGKAIDINAYPSSYTFNDVDSDHRISVVYGKADLAAPAKLTLQLSTAKNGYDNVKASWTKVEGADGYRIYYKKSAASKWNIVEVEGKTTYTTGNLTDGAKYSFRVIPFVKNGDNIVETEKYRGSTITTLKKITNVKVSRSGSKVKVSWTNIGGETGYQISKTLKKSKTSIVSTYKTTTGKSKLVKATKGKKYYYKVRAYKSYKVDGEYVKVYGPWSTAEPYRR